MAIDETDKLFDLLNEWRSDKLTATSNVGDSAIYINQLYEAVPLLAGQSMLLSTTVLTDKSSWDTLQPNTVHYFSSFGSEGSPTTLVDNQAGYLFYIKSSVSTRGLQLCITNDLHVLYRLAPQGTWIENASDKQVSDLSDKITEFSKEIAESGISALTLRVQSLANTIKNMDSGISQEQLAELDKIISQKLEIYDAKQLVTDFLSNNPMSIYDDGKQLLAPSINVVGNDKSISVGIADPNIANVAEYQVEISTDQKNWSINTVPNLISDINNLVNGTTYYVRAKIVSSDATIRTDSNYSDVVSVIVGSNLVSGDNSAVGTNLITNSNFSSGLDGWTVNGGSNSDCKAVVTTDSDGDTCVHITGTGNVCGIYRSPVSFNQNQVTTGSVLVKGTGTLMYIGLEYRPYSNFGTISTDSYSKVGSTMQATANTNNFIAYFNSVNGVLDVYIKSAKLEIGSIATDWTPAPEDKKEATIPPVKQYPRTSKILRPSSVFALTTDLQNAVDTLTKEKATTGYVDTGLANVQSKIDTMQNTITNKVDNLQIGSRNYVLNSNEKVTVAGTNIIGQLVNTWSLSPDIINIASGSTVTISYDVLVTNADTGMSYLGMSSPWTVLLSAITYKSGMNRISLTLKLPRAFVTGETLQMTVDSSKASYVVSNLKLEQGSIATDWTPAPEDKVNVSDTANWQKQKIFQDGNYMYATCPSGTDFGEFLKSDSVPVGFSIIRDDNKSMNWRIIKESAYYVYGITNGYTGSETATNSAVIYTLNIENGTYSDYVNQRDKYQAEYDKRYLKPWTGTQAQYDALGTYDGNTLYLITG